MSNTLPLPPAADETPDLPMHFSSYPNDAPDHPALDDYVRQHPRGSAYHLHAWRQAVQQAYGYPGRVLVARGSDGRIAGLLPLCEVALPLGRPRWVSLPFCDLGGPLADTPDIAAQLASHAARVLASGEARKMELRCSLPQAAGNEDELAGKKVRMLLSLPDSAEQLFAAYPPKLRSQIRKAEKNGLTAAISTDSRDVDKFYTVYSKNMRRLGSPPHSRSLFEAVLNSYAASGEAFIALVYKGDDVVGAGLVLRCGDKAVIPWASTLAEFNHLAPNMLLYWQVQAHLCAAGVAQFDFGRSTYAEGTYKFKKQWGASPWPLDWQQWTADGMVPAAATAAGGGSQARAMVESVWQKLPLALTNTLGPCLRRYITL